MANADKSSYVLVNTEELLKDTVAEIHKYLESSTEKFLAVDCEGHDLGRQGTLDVLILATKQKVFIVDVYVLKQTAFDFGLKSILESDTILKLMFDCRCDADVLKHHYGVDLNGILDLQLLDVLYRRKKYNKQPPPKSSPAFWDLQNVEFISGFKKCLELYATDRNLVRAKAYVGMYYRRDPYIWSKRPIPEELMQYCIADSFGMFDVYSKLRDIYSMEELKTASQRYADYLRVKASRTNDKYENHPFLPLYIISDDGRGFPQGDKQCSECRRWFDSEEFSRAQMSMGNQKCRVCRKVDTQRPRR